MQISSLLNNDPPDWSPPSVKVDPQEEYLKLVQSRPTAQNLDPIFFIESIKKYNRLYNRFPNVLPNEPTRFKLQSDPSFYFNANWVMGGRALASQYPLIEEHHRFWKMVWEGNIKTIVMLANIIPPLTAFIPAKIKPCGLYWEDPDIAPYTIVKRSENIVLVENENQIYLREFLLKKGNQDQRMIKHYHLANWPDGDVVSPSILAELVKMVSTNKDQEPLLVHCNAGIGRTGTFLATYQAFQENNPNLFQIAQDLRDPQKGRVGAIQTPFQYALAKEAIKLLLRPNN